MLLVGYVYYGERVCVCPGIDMYTWVGASTCALVCILVGVFTWMDVFTWVGVFT